MSDQSIKEAMAEILSGCSDAQVIEYVQFAQNAHQINLERHGLTPELNGEKWWRETLENEVNTRQLTI